MDNQKLREIFEKEGSVAIIVGSSYTIDEMGAALGLYLALNSKGKDLSVVSTKQPLVEVSNLVGINNVKPQVESKGGDLVVSFPYLENEIDKVSYTLENSYLNIIVKPKENELSFGEKDVIFKRSGDNPSTIITVGIKRLSELTPFFNIESLKDTTIVNIDRPINNEGYGDLVLIGQNASSVSEQVADLLLAISYPVDQDIAQNLMSGIIFATSNFQSSKTSSLAFEMAGVLLRNGAKREVVNQSKTPQAQQQRPQQKPQQKQIRDYPRDLGKRSIQKQGRSSNQGQIPAQEQIPNQEQLPTQEQGINQNKPQATPPDWLSPKIFKGSTNVE